MTIPPLRRALPPIHPRQDDAHKGSFGHLLIVAGSTRMSGAARLCGTAALRGGVGLLTIATPRAAWPVVAMENPAWMTLPLEDADGYCAAAAMAEIESSWESKTALAVGPGLGRSDGVVQLVRAIYARCPLPLVLDADGLNAFAGDADLLSQRPSGAARILTPHPGEFAKLVGTSVASVQENRQSLAVEFAQQHNVTVLLKGPATVITDGERLAINPTGNSGMARGGTGDILTGLIAALLAQRMDAFDAAQLGAYLQGLAGDIAAEKHTQQAMLVTEVLDCFAEAWRRVSQRQT